MGSESTYRGTDETGDGGRLLAEQQAALRRVTTLVAEGATAAELFTAVVEEVVAVLDVPAGWLFRYEPDRSVSVLASLNGPGFPVGSRWQLDGPSLSATILERLGSLALAARGAEFNVPPERGDLRKELSAIATGLTEAVEGLQELSRGIHPAILSERGFGPALRTLARRSAIPVDLDITTDVRLAEPIEVAAYFVASEALANAVKHSDASRIDVSLERRHGNLLLSVCDDGVGGADAARGSGIVGLNDRVEALGGRFALESPPGRGTTISVELPIATPAAP
jgi:hypothetical protein